MDPQLRQVTNAFQATGLMIRPRAARMLLESARKMTLEADISKALQEFISVTKVLNQRQPADAQIQVVDNDWATQIINQAKNVDAEVAVATEHLGDGVFIYDAFKDIPRYHYDTGRKQFVNGKSPTILGEPTSVAQYYRDRYRIILRGMLTGGQFVESGSQSAARANNKQYVLTPVESLKGNPGKKIVFGLMTRAQEGTWCIEDFHRSVPIDTSRCKYTDLITEGAFIVGMGEMDLTTNTFAMFHVAYPPVCPRTDSLTDIDFFGTFFIFQ